MSILNDIRVKEQREYKNMNHMVKTRVLQIKDVQYMREARDLSKTKPKKIILPCVDCGKPNEFFKDESIKICNKCMY